MHFPHFLYVFFEFLDIEGSQLFEAFSYQHLTYQLLIYDLGVFILCL